MTIFALSSGHGKAGVAVVRVSGEKARDAVAALAGKLPKPRQAVLRLIRHPVSAEALDRALVLWFPAPHSFTGEDAAEFHVHGGRAVIAAVMDALGSLEGVRQAEAGEFARRAFENGKMDLTAIEGLADLIDAETEAQRRQALRQLDGALAELYERWRADLISAMAQVEAALDFADEGDVPEDVSAKAAPIVERLFGEISDHLADDNRGEILRDGFHIVIAGPPNAGKSSLLNALARRDVAIVSDEAGTTRDVIEVHLDLDGFPVIVTDTAGIRTASGKIEQEGIRRAVSRAQAADLVVWLVDAANKDSAPVPDEWMGRSGVQLIRVLNKIDLVSGTASEGGEGYLHVSVKTGEGLSALVGRLTEEVRSRVGDMGAPMISRERHRAALLDAREALKRYMDGDISALELRAEDLRHAATRLGRITGRVDVEDVLDQIFAGFCIGK